MRTRLFILALGATVLGVQSGAPQDVGPPPEDDKFYGDIGYNRLGRDLIGSGDAYASPEFGTVSGHIGYRFTDHWSVEGEGMVGVENEKIQFRSFTDLTSVRGQNTFDLNNLVGAYVRGDIPVTSKLNAFARAGVAHADIGVSSIITATDNDTEETTVTTPEYSFSETGIALGIGLTYDLTDRIYLRSDYSRYDLDDAELDSVGVGIGLRF